MSHDSKTHLRNIRIWKKIKNHDVIQLKEMCTYCLVSIFWPTVCAVLQNILMCTCVDVTGL